MKENKQYFLPRTDLACETDIKLGQNKDAFQKEYTDRGFDIIRTDIMSEAASKSLGKGQGTYVTVFTRDLQRLSESEREALTEIVSETISSAVTSALGRKTTPSELSILVAGLGNRHLTADAIGPLVTEKITITRDLKYSDPRLFERIGCASVSAVTPGVSAETGIEAADIIKGAVTASLPDAVLLIDALAARSTDRLASTVQISDTGISPGSGIGNKRTPITKDTIGVPVITVGVPTIVDSSSLVYDALSRGGISEDEINEKLSYVLSNEKSFFVSPKDCDLIVKDMSSLIADAIDLFFGVPF